MENISKYNYIIVGAGLTGSTIARKLADDGYKVLIIEKRNNIAGNLYDYKHECGLMVQKYGPHTFHTNDDNVISFVKRFATFIDYSLKCEVYIDGITTPSPFNFKTIDQFYNEKDASILKEELLKGYHLRGFRERQPINQTIRTTSFW